MVRQDSGESKTGLLEFSITIILIILGICFAPFTVFIEVDTFSIFLNTKGLLVASDRFLLHVLQKLVVYVMIQWCTLESTRIYISLLLPLLGIFSIYVACLKNLYDRALSQNVIALYRQLYCINQVGFIIIRYLTGTLMGFGLLLAVCCNRIVLVGWNTFPISIYFSCLGFLAITYFVIALAVPYAICSNEESECLLKRWRNQVQFKYATRLCLKKQVWSLRPVAIYYADTKFERDTKVNYYFNIVSYTVNLLLVR